MRLIRLPLRPSVRTLAHPAPPPGSTRHCKEPHNVHHRDHPPPCEREPQLIVRDAAYALTALADEAVTNVKSLGDKLEQLREDAPAKAKELRETAPERVKTLPADAQGTLEERRARVEAQLTELRERAAKDVDERLASFEASFDAKAAAGADRVAELRKDERVARVETAFEPVTDQVKIARSQVKGAITSVRKTVDAAVEAGRAQADNARSQVKAAATSTRKTVDTVVEAGRGIAS